MCSFVASSRSTPHARDRMLALLALTLVQVHLLDDEARPFNDEAVAFGTISVLGGMSRDISDIHILQTFPIGHCLEALQRRNRSRWQVLQKVERREAREMYGDIGSQLSLDPTRHVANLRVTVVECRHREIHDLQPPSLLANCLLYTSDA